MNLILSIPVSATALSKREKGHVARLKEELSLSTDEPLDHKKVCELMRFVEDERKEEGKPLRVESLSFLLLTPSISFESTTARHSNLVLSKKVLDRLTVSCYRGL